MTKKGGNKTIATSLADGRHYLERCLPKEDLESDPTSGFGRTILGDMLEICPLLPERCADLMIADPAYNLRKTFAGTTFARKKADACADYTRRWRSVVKPLLKDVCRRSRRRI